MLNKKFILFLVSFLALFLELALIRYIPANVRLVGFFTNLILLASFAGTGIGFLLAKKKWDVFFISPIFILVLVFLTRIFQVEVGVATSEIIFFKGIFERGIEVEPFYLLPLLYILVAIIFIPIGQKMGKLFSGLKPLTAYSYDILGAICGVVMFSVLALFSTPAWVWFLIVCLLFSYILYSDNRIKILLLISPIFFILTATIWYFNSNGVWSPYYKISLTKLDKNVYDLSTNNISHQYISHFAIREPFYFTAYEEIPNHNYKRVLIIGAGTGGDVATGLASAPEIERIDAVEIDPVIIKYGKALNPDRPYDNPKVHIYNTDGRQFLRTTENKYDLIIFALTDSLVLANTSGNIRLESFLYTKESFEEAKNRLTPNGLVVLYNYYRESWLVEKLAKMLQTDSKEKIGIIRSFQPGVPATIFAGPKLKEVKSLEAGSISSEIDSDLPIATDDWPNLYLKNKSVPVYYINFLVIIALATIVMFLLATGFKKGLKLDLRFFLFGAGFLLLETKSLTTFSLIFGATWVVNSLVFVGILLFVLLANIISAKFTIKRLWILYVLLFTMLAANYFVPPSIFLNFGTIERYILSISFYFSSGWLF